MSQVEQINPKMLAWARETAGFTLPEAAPKLGLKDGARASAAEKLASIENNGQISRAVLQKAAAIFRRPLITFYLPDVPPHGDRGEDFRAPAAGAVARSLPRKMACLTRSCVTSGHVSSSCAKSLRTKKNWSAVHSSGQCRKTPARSPCQRPFG